jgi:WD40 repeat protein
MPADALRRFGDVAFWHPGGISGSALSDDGKLLATAARRSIVVWDVASGTPVHRFDTGMEMHYSTQKLVFSPDGNRLAACPGSTQVFVWDLSLGKEIKRFEHRDRLKPFNSVHFTADGLQLVVSQSNKIDVYDIATWKVRSLDCRARFLSRSTGTLVDLNQAGKVCFIDFITGRMTAELETTTVMDGLANGLALASDGKSLAVYRKQGEIELWSVPGGKRLQSMKATGSTGQHTVAFSRDGKTVFLGTTSGVCRWDVATGRELPKWERRFDSNFGRLTGIHVLADNDTLIACAEDGLVRRYSLKQSKELPRPDGYAGRTAVAATRDGSRIVIGDQEGRVDVWKVNDALCERTLSEKGSTIRALAFSPDEETVAIGRMSGDLELVDVASTKTRHVFKVPVNESRHIVIRDVFFHPDGSVVFARNWVGRLMTWRLSDKKQGWDRMKERAGAFMADGKTLVVAVSGPELLFTDPTTGEIRHRVKVEVNFLPFDGLPALAFSPDAKWLVLATSDRFLRFCNPLTAVEKARVECVDPPSDPLMASLARGSLYASSLAFSADGKWLVTGGTDSLVRIWEVATRKEVCRLSGHEKRVTFVAFGPGGRSVISSGEDGAVYQWELRPKSSATVDDPWSDLASDDPVIAYRAIWKLADSPAAAVKLLRSNLPPTKAESAERIKQLVQQLGSDRFAVRETAMKTLSGLGRGVESAFKDALSRKDLPAEAKERARKLLGAMDDVPVGEDLRRSRAVQALELAGTDVARELLGEWSRGAPGAFLTDDADAALRRLTAARRPGAR